MPRYQDGALPDYGHDRLREYVHSDRNHSVRGNDRAYPAVNGRGSIDIKRDGYDNIRDAVEHEKEDYENGKGTALHWFNCNGSPVIRTHLQWFFIWTGLSVIWTGHWFLGWVEGWGVYFILIVDSVPGSRINGICGRARSFSEDIKLKIHVIEPIKARLSEVL